MRDAEAWRWAVQQALIYKNGGGTIELRLIHHRGDGFAPSHWAAHVGNKVVFEGDLFNAIEAVIAMEVGL